MKRILYCVLVVCLAFGLFTGCKPKEETKEKAIEQSTYEQVQKALIGMQTYVSEASVTYISNKNSNTYETLQQCKSSGEYRVEVISPERAAGNITISDGAVITQFNKRINGKVSIATKENMDRSEIFVTSFVKNYVQSQEVSVSVGNFGSGKATVLEAVIPGNHPYLATEKLWVDNKTLKPVKLVVYDPDGSERIVVMYKTFEYNIELEETVFKAV